ncbi:MAG: XdhC family protein [Acidobacteriaceae bacterium]|nr:XdhC family protein [Acidobacteriaceae bacterium]
MKEISQILELWNQARQSGESVILATVLRTRGSSYRVPGARLLLTSTGGRAGSVSGGCLEDDLLKKAWWLTRNGPVIRRFDTTPEGEIATDGFGLGCNGIIHVLLERDSSILPLLQEVTLRRRAAAVAHMVAPESKAGQRLTIDTEGIATSNFSDPRLATLVEPDARQTLSCSTRHSMLHDGSELFLEALTPAVRLLLFGAGDDAVPVTEMANFLGWQVFVLDGRSHYARAERFPRANEVLVYRPEEPYVLSLVDPWTVAVLMSHSYSQDLAALKQLAVKPPRYLGILGPRKRTEQLMSDAGLEPAQLAPALHAPMGLDIGADGREQVALSVIAEIQATLNGRQGAPLRERGGAIHASEAETSAPWVGSIACA